MKKTFQVLTVVVVLVGLAAGAADAQTNPMKRRPASAEAQRHLDQGNRYFRILDYEKAIVEYKAGAAIEGHDIFYFNLAQAYRQTGRYEEAIRLYEQWLSRANPPADMRKGVEGLVEQMKAELAKKASTQPPTGPAADVPAPQDVVDEPAQPHDSQPIGREPPPVVAPGRWYSDPLGWTGVGVGTVASAVGASFLVSGLGMRDDAQDADLQADRHDLADRADTRVAWGITLGAVGAAVLVGGVAKLAVHDRSSSTTSMSVSFGPGGVGIAGSF